MNQETSSDDFPRIVEVPEICHGEPKIKGTRIVVSAIISDIREGLSASQIIYYSPELTVDEIDEVMRYTNFKELL